MRWIARLGPVDPTTQRHTIAEWIRVLADSDRNGMQGCVTLLRPALATADSMRETFRLATDGDNGRVVSIAEITRRFNTHGPPPKSGQRWNRSTVNALLVNESYVAIQRDPKNVARRALWEPLVDLKTWERVWELESFLTDVALDAGGTRRPPRVRRRRPKAPEPIADRPGEIAEG